MRDSRSGLLARLSQYVVERDRYHLSSGRETRLSIHTESKYIAFSMA
jgi:hypothetical protein